MTKELINRPEVLKFTEIRVEQDLGVIEDTELTGILAVILLDMAIKSNKGNDDYLQWLLEEINSI